MFSWLLCSLKTTHWHSRSSFSQAGQNGGRASGVTPNPESMKAYNTWFGLHAVVYYPSLLQQKQTYINFHPPGPFFSICKLATPNLSTPINIQKSFRNPNPYWSRRKYGSTPPMCTAVRRKGNPTVQLPFVLQCASHLYSSTCEKILGVGVTGKFLKNAWFLETSASATSWCVFRRINTNNLSLTFAGRLQHFNVLEPQAFVHTVGDRMITYRFVCLRGLFSVIVTGNFTA